MRVQLLDNRTVGVFFEYSPRLVSIVKNLPGRSFEPRLKAWLLPVDGLTPVSLGQLKQAGFDGVEGVLDRLAPESKPINDFNASDSPLLPGLRPYQHTKALEAISRRGGLIRGFCGCGKTAISLAVMQALGCSRVLVVCPKSVLLNWPREISLWLGDTARSFPVQGTPSQRRAIYKEYLEYAGTKYLVMTYDTMRIDVGTFHSSNWDAIIYDEVHYLVNTSSQRSKAARLLKATHKYGLTATPVMNSATDVFGIFRALDRDLGNWKTFTDRYCVRDMWNSVKYFKNMDELKARISPWIVPIDLEEAKFELPERTDTDIEFELSPVEASLYNRIRSELLFELEAQEVSKLSSPVILQNTLVKLGKLQELTDSCELLGDNSHSTKLEVLKEHLENSLINGQKAIIFTRFSRMAEILGRELRSFNPVILTGATQNRQEEIDRFTQDSSTRIFISTEAGGVGVNLQAANIVYNYDLPFSLGKLEQRLGRIRWHTQDRPVFFYNLLAKVAGKNSIDHWVLNKIIKKQAMADKLLLADVKEILE